ncbi:MAG: carboxypeptidase regulatory-like domain-containing protein [Acidobacteriota bacterium]
MMRVAFFALLTGLIALAQVSKGARIEGIVVTADGKPMAGAQVKLSRRVVVQGTQVTTDGVYFTTSDVSGRFALEDITTGGTYLMNAQRSGFATGWYGARSAIAQPAAFSVQPGQVLKGVRLVMLPQGVIFGRVTDSNGEPVRDARVQAMRRGYQDGVRQMIAVKMAISDEQGKYRLENLNPGRYFLVVQSSAIVVTGGGQDPKMGVLRTYYPNATEELAAAPLDLGPGQEIPGMDIRLRQGKVFSVRGKVVTANGPPAAGFGILALPSTNGDSLQVLTTIRGKQNQTREDGSFELLGLPRGTYTLQGYNIATQGTRTAGRMEIRIFDEDVEDVVLSLGDAGAVSGRIRMEDGDLKTILTPDDARPLRELLASKTDVPGRMTVGLKDLSRLPMGNNPSAKIGDDGTFSVTGAAPGIYQLTFGSMSPDIYVKSARFNGVDVTRDPVDISAGAAGSLEILLSDRAAEISGTVSMGKDESPVGVTVSLWTRDAEPIRTTTADESGNFRFRGLRPGVYYLAGWDDIDPGLAQMRDFLTQFTSEAAKVELAERAHATAEVQVTPAAKRKAAEEKLP